VNEGTVYKRCYCKDVDTGRALGAACPQLRKPRHGSWAYQFRLEAGGRQYRRGGFKSQTDAHQAMQQARADLSAAPLDAAEVSLSTRDWLLFWLAEKEQRGGASAAGRKVAATTARGYRAHLELYLIPSLGDIVLTELAAPHIARLFRDLEAAQSTRSRPLTAASIRRVYATLRSALNAAVRQQKLDRNPALQIDLASGARPKAMVWTRERVAVWQRTGKRPSPVMVWTPEQTGAFLDSAAQDPLYALYHLIASTAWAAPRRGGRAVLDGPGPGGRVVARARAGRPAGLAHAADHSQGRQRAGPGPGRRHREGAGRAPATAGGRAAVPGAGPGGHRRGLHPRRRSAGAPGLRHPAGTSAGWSSGPDSRPSGCTTCGTGQRRWRSPAAWR
jgi:hypothetical protein